MREGEWDFIDRIFWVSFRFFFPFFVLSCYFCFTVDSLLLHWGTFVKMMCHVVSRK
jgi:hypothetical protein